MNIGMLWYDNSNRPLAEKILAAARYYQKKYRRTPDTCIVHPSMAVDHLTKVAGITIKTSPNVKPNYIWIGVDHD
jgi:hypothetical protein